MPAELSNEVKQRVIDNIGKYSDLQLTIDFESTVRYKGKLAVKVTCNVCNYSVERRSVESLCTKKYLCNGCTIERYRKFSEQFGYTYISHKGNVIQAACKCGTHCVLHSAGLLRGCPPRCETCLVQGYVQKLEPLNFTYITRSSAHKRKTVTVKCNVHNHIQTVEANSVLNGKPVCPLCRTQSYNDALYTKGCRLVEVKKVDSTRSRVHYMNEKGEVFDADTSAILAGKFANSTGGEWYSKHSTYVIRLENNGNIYCKIGTAQEPEKRLARLKLIGNAEVFTLASFDDRFGADKLESELQREFKVFKLPKEIASTFTQAIVMSKRKGRTERVPCADGYTEWYQGNEVFETLNKRYKLKE